MFTDAHEMTKHLQHVDVCVHIGTRVIVGSCSHILLIHSHVGTHGRAQAQPGAVVLAKGCGEKRSNSNPRHDLG